MPLPELINDVTELCDELGLSDSVVMKLIQHVEDCDFCQLDLERHGAGLGSTAAKAHKGNRPDPGANPGRSTN